MTEYIYVRKCEFIGNDGKFYYWFYQSDKHGCVSDREKYIRIDMSIRMYHLGFNSETCKHSKVKFIQKDSVELMKLKRRLKVKERFKKFLKDEEIYYCFWMNFKDYDINNKISYPEDYISGSFSWFRAKYCSFDVWNDLNKKWQNILRNEFNYNI